MYPIETEPTVLEIINTGPTMAYEPVFELVPEHLSKYRSDE